MYYVNFHNLFPYDTFELSDLSFVIWKHDFNCSNIVDFPTCSSDDERKNNIVILYVE